MRVSMYRRDTVTVRWTCAMRRQGRLQNGHCDNCGQVGTPLSFESVKLDY